MKKIWWMVSVWVLLQTVSDFAWWRWEWRPVWSGQAVQPAWLMKGFTGMPIPCTQLHAQISVSSAAQEECSYHVMIKMLFNTRDQFFLYLIPERSILLCMWLVKWLWLLENKPSYCVMWLIGGFGFKRTDLKSICSIEWSWKDQI